MCSARGASVRPMVIVIQRQMQGAAHSSTTGSTLSTTSETKTLSKPGTSFSASSIARCNRSIAATACALAQTRFRIWKEGAISRAIRKMGMGSHRLQNRNHDRVQDLASVLFVILMDGGRPRASF